MSQKKVPTQKKKWRIGVLAGDGIGPEVMKASMPIFRKAAELAGHEIEFINGLVGWAAHDVYNDVMPGETWERLSHTDAFLFGAVGLPARDPSLPLNMRPERRALLPLRQKFNLAVNIRPVKIYRGFGNLSPLKTSLVANGTDTTFFRELLGDMYFGKKRLSKNGKYAVDECKYTIEQIETIARAAFEYARATGKKVMSIDKQNVLLTLGTVWRDTVQGLRDREYQDVELAHQYVDSMTNVLVSRLESCQIVLAGNMFGDILSDLGASLVGSLGLLPSASINPKNSFGMYEPGSGSAPDIANKDIANPIAMILSGAMMFEHTFKDPKTANRIEEAVKRTLRAGFRTADIYRPRSDLKEQLKVGTADMAQAILEHLK